MRTEAEIRDRIKILEKTIRELAASRYDNSAMVARRKIEVLEWVLGE